LKVNATVEAISSDETRTNLSYCFLKLRKC